MKKRAVLFGLIGLMTSSLVFAGEFRGIEPGISTRSDVFSRFGKPKEEVIKNTRYIFDASQYDLKVLSVVIDEQTSRVTSIELYPNKTQYFSDFKNWFKLNDPFDQSYDAEGNLVETFLPHAVKLHYNGPNNQAPVLFFEHVDLLSFDDYSMLPKKRPYLGMRLMPHTGAGYKIQMVEAASPAEEAGFKSGDIITAINGTPYTAKEYDPTSFVNILTRLPMNEKIVFVLSRLDEEGQASDVTCTAFLREMTDAQIETSVQESLVLFEQGQFLLQNGDMYGALDLFKNALWLNPYEPIFYASLADVYYRIGLADFAIEELEKSVRMSPQYFPYFLLATIYSEKGDLDKAIAHFRKALALNAEDLQIREKLGYLFMKKDMYNEALKVFADVLQRKADSQSALFFSALCNEKMNRSEEAFVLYKKFLAVEPTHQGMKDEATAKVEAFRLNGRFPQ
jgi:tetratricopeptide (TPR) repeat protein